MPALEMAQETGKLIAWRKQEGDRVTKGEPLLEIETDKAVVEVEAPADGILAGIKASAGAEIPVGQTIAWIVAPGEAPPVESESAAPAARAGSHAKAEPHSRPSRRQLAAAPQRPRTARRFLPRPAASPKNWEWTSPRCAAPARAERFSLPICRRAASACSRVSPQPEKNPASIEVPSSLGRIMAERTTQSWTTVPHFFVSRDIEASALNEYRERIVAEIERTHQRPHHAYRSAGGAGGPRSAEASAPERQLERRGHSPARSREHGRSPSRSKMAWWPPSFPTLTPRASPKSRSSAAMWPSARGPGSCAPPTSPTRPSPSAISACIRWISSARSSRRRKPRFSR